MREFDISTVLSRTHPCHSVTDAQERDEAANWLRRFEGAREPNGMARVRREMAASFEAQNSVKGSDSPFT